MVLIHYKKTDYDQFFFETSSSRKVEELIEELVEVNNLRIVLDRLCISITDLATHGVLKPEETRGLPFEMVPDEKGNLPEKGAKEDIKLLPGQRYNEDKSRYRTGVILSEELTKVLLTEVENAKKIISKENQNAKQPLTKKALSDPINNLRGAIMIAYPAYHGLPEWEPARMILEDKFDFSNVSQDNYEYLKPQESSIWWAGKEFQRGKTLADYVGKNEKTKIVVKLQKSGGGAPAREPMVDQESYKNMLSFYHKKQEEMKKLEEDNDDSYLNAPWADPKGLKNQLIGGGRGVSWKPK